MEHHTELVLSYILHRELPLQRWSLDPYKSPRKYLYVCKICVRLFRGDNIAFTANEPLFANQQILGRWICSDSSIDGGTCCAWLRNCWRGTRMCGCDVAPRYEWPTMCFGSKWRIKNKYQRTLFSLGSARFLLQLLSWMWRIIFESLLAKRLLIIKNVAQNDSRSACGSFSLVFRICVHLFFANYYIILF